MLDNVTVIHYTANNKPTEFSQRVRDWNMSAIGNNLPIISISQKPIDFGENICVGDVGVSLHNAWRQIQIGASKATTKFICLVEDDRLYPSTYFRFIPDRHDTFYIPIPIYVLWSKSHNNGWWAISRHFPEGAGFASRDFVIASIETCLSNYGMWCTPEDIAKNPKRRSPFPFRYLNNECFTISEPIIQFRLDTDMHKKARFDKRTVRTGGIPYWGSGRKLIDKFVTYEYLNSHTI